MQRETLETLIIRWYTLRCLKTTAWNTACHWWRIWHLIRLYFILSEISLLSLYHHSCIALGQTDSVDSRFIYILFCYLSINIYLKTLMKRHKSLCCLGRPPSLTLTIPGSASVFQLAEVRVVLGQENLEQARSLQDIIDEYQEG